MKYATALIVDDDTNVQAAVKSSLEERGFRCDVAADGIDARGLMSTRQYDVIVTEVLFPRTNGGELVVDMCALECTPIIAVHTGVFQRAVYLGLRDEGVDAVFFKPHDYSLMADAIASLYRRRSETNRRRPLVSKLQEYDAWIQGSEVRVEMFRFIILLLALVLFSLGVGSSIVPGLAGICRMCGLVGLAFYFCLEFVAYTREQERAATIRRAAERRLAEHAWRQKEAT